MAYETLIEEAKSLPDSIIEQTLMFMRFLRSNASEEDMVADNTDHTFHRTVSPLAGDFVFMADDFDKTPDCFGDYL